MSEFSKLLDNFNADQIDQSFRINDDDFISAMGAAFGLVACSDGVLERCEIHRFMSVVKSTETLSSFPWNEIEDRFNDITKDILKNGLPAKEKALVLVAKIESNLEYKQAVLSCAQTAIIANFKIQDVEESVFKEICKALSVSTEEN